MDFEKFLLENKNKIKENSLITPDEKMIKKTDDWYYEDCWDEMYQEVKGVEYILNN